MTFMVILLSAKKANGKTMRFHVQILQNNILGNKAVLNSRKLRRFILLFTITVQKGRFILRLMSF